MKYMAKYCWLTFNILVLLTATGVIAGRPFAMGLSIAITFILGFLASAVMEKSNGTVQKHP